MPKVSLSVSDFQNSKQRRLLSSVELNCPLNLTWIVTLLALVNEETPTIDHSVHHCCFIPLHKTGILALKLIETKDLRTLWNRIR